MAVTYPITIGRTKRFKDKNDELAMQEFAAKLKGLFTAGTDAPDSTNSGMFHVQYSPDSSYSRLWIKCPDGQWR